MLDWFRKLKEKTDLKLLLKCVAIPLVVGAISAFVTRSGMKAFEDMNQPPLTPPQWVFPVVWSILYIFMGIASYLVAVSGATEEDKKKANTFYFYQLVVNFLWPVFFFQFQWFLFAFLWLVLLLVLVFITKKLFCAIDKRAGYLFFPYMIWLIFAGYLNLGVWILNR